MSRLRRRKVTDGNANRFIKFEEELTKTVLAGYCDTTGNGKVSKKEASKNSLKEKQLGGKIKKFNEFPYFYKGSADSEGHLDMSNIFTIASGESPMLEEITFPDKTWVSGYNSQEGFSDNTALKVITFQGSVYFIAQWCGNNTNLEKVVIKDASLWLNDIILEDALADYRYSSRHNPMLQNDNVKLYVGEKVIKSFKFPKDITTIRMYCFAGTNMLDSSFVLPTSITSIAKYAFYKNPNIVTIDLSKVSNISYGAFSGCSSLKSVILKSDLTVLGGDYHPDAPCGIFQDCVSLESINIPDSLTFIGYNTFANCTKLTNINALPSNLQKLGYYAFRNVVTNISEIPSSVTELGQGCLASNSITTIKFKGDSFITYSVYSTDWKPFPTNTIIIVNSETLVDEYESNSNWRNCINSQNYKFILSGNITFADSNVKQVLIDNGVDTDGDGEISYLEAAKCTSVGTWFKDNTDIISFNEFKWFKGITEIGYYNFSNCISLKTIEFSVNTKIIGDSAFRGCTSLNITNLPNTLTTVYNWAFRETAVSITEIPSTISSLGIGSFSYCQNITNITVNASVSRLPTSIFEGCQSLKTVTLADNITIIGQEAFSGCTNLSSFPTNNNINELEIFAFKGSTFTLTSIPSTITIIRPFAFYQSSGLNITEIPATVTLIGQGSLDCNKSTKVKLLSTTKVTLEYYNTGASEQNIGSKYVYVPDDLYDEYVNDENWSKLGNQTICKLSDWTD